MFEIELFICTKIYRALNSLQRLICHKAPHPPKKTNKQINKQTTLRDIKEQAFVLEDMMHKILGYLEIQTENSVTDKGPDLVSINNNKKKKIVPSSRLYRSSRVQNENLKKVKNRLKEGNKQIAVVHKGYSNSIYNWPAGKISDCLERKSGGAGLQKRNRYHSDYSIVEIGQNSWKSPRDRERFAVIQTLVKDYQVKLLKNLKINNNRLGLLYC